MPQFHETADGRVYIRTDAGTYGDTRENFEADFGRPLEAMPSGAVEHIYTPGVVHTYMADGNVVDGGPRTGWQYGDDAIAAFDQMMGKQATRIAVQEAADRAAREAQLKTTTLSAS
jgi:hypothetical protein